MPKKKLKNDKVYEESAKKERWIRASPEVFYSYDYSCTVKLDEEKSKHAGLPEENGFGSALIAEFPMACKKA